MANPVKMRLVGLDSNAFSLMGAFGREARRQGWTAKEVDVVCNECMEGDYDHLLRTLMANVDEPIETGDEDEFPDDDDDWDDDDDDDDDDNEF